MSEDDFDASAMDGPLSNLIVLPLHRMALGLQHPPGCDLRVCIWDAERLRRMSQAAARRFARELEEGPFAAAFIPVVEALRTLCDLIDEINARVAAERAVALTTMPVEGHA